MEPTTDVSFEEDPDNFRVQSFYMLRRQSSQESGGSTDSSSKSWFSCGRRQLRGRRTGLYFALLLCTVVTYSFYSVSEASVYRTSSKYSLKSVGPTSKTLDCLMQCFWLCSPGCQQTA